MLKLLNTGEVTQGVRGRLESAKQAARPDTEVVLLKPGAAGPPQDVEQCTWAVGGKLGRGNLPPPQAWNKYVKAGTEIWNGGNRELARAAAF